MFKVFYKYSACIKVCTSDVSILFDPWFGDNAYDGTWTQYPKYENIFELVGEFDYIYISHIHPDHYCKDTLKSLFDKYGEKKILIADWGKNHTNYLERKLASDGFQDLLEISNKKRLGNTLLDIIPNKTGSKSDIDSAIVVSSKVTKHALLNINDCIYNKFLFKKIIKLKEELDVDFNLFCLGYTGAGPYPQTYYSPKLEKEILIQKSEEKKLSFFNRYKKAISEIPSKKRLPFAGKYLLQGNFSKLNKFRGVADALEIKEFDKDAIIIDDNGENFFDIEKMACSKERKKLYKIPDQLYPEKEYFWREVIKFDPSKSLLKRLLIKSIFNAHNKSECEINCFFSIYVYDTPDELEEIWNVLKPQEIYEPLITFNCNKNEEPLKICHKSIIHSHIFLEKKALFAVLTGITHWNNYEFGSVFQVRRVPDLHNQEMQNYLNFLSVI